MTRKGEIDGVKFQIVENNVIEEQNAIPAGRRKQLDGLVGGYINAGVQNGYDARVGAKSLNINAPEFAAILKDLNDRDTWAGKTLSSAEKCMFGANWRKPAANSISPSKRMSAVPTDRISPG